MSGLGSSLHARRCHVCRYFIEYVGNNVSDRNEIGNTALDEILSSRHWLRSMSLRTGPPHCVMYLLRAVAQLGGPVPRLPRVVVEIYLYLEDDDMTADDREFRSASHSRVRQWTEAECRVRPGLEMEANTCTCRRG